MLSVDMLSSPMLSSPTLNGGAGAVWEKNPGMGTDTSGTLNAGEELQFKLSETASINQVLTALWTMNNFEDMYLHFGIGLAASVTSNTEIKIEFLDDYKNVTPSSDIKKNDTAVLASFLFKF